MELRNLRYFLAVADAGSITLAAQSLHLSQPPLSTAMAKLEVELGVKLFDRTPRGITLTAAGRYLQTAGRRLLSEERRVADTLRAMGEGLEGELRIGVEAMGLWHTVGTRVATFLAEHPQVSLEIIDAHPLALLENLANGHLDLAVFPVLEQEPLPSINDVAFRVDVVDTLPLTVVAPRAWDLDGNGPVDIASLREQTWVMPARIPGTRSLSRILDDGFSTAGGSPTRVVPVSTVQTAAALVAAGVGLSLVSTETIAHHPGVTALPVVGGWPDLPLGIVRRRDGVGTPIAERFTALFPPAAAPGR